MARCPLCLGTGDLSEDVPEAAQATKRMTAEEIRAMADESRGAPPAPETFDVHEASTMPSGSWTIAHLERVIHRRRVVALLVVGVLLLIATVTTGLIMALHR